MLPKVWICDRLKSLWKWKVILELEQNYGLNGGARRSRFLTCRVYCVFSRVILLLWKTDGLQICRVRPMLPVLYARIVIS